MAAETEGLVQSQEAEPHLSGKWYVQPQRQPAMSFSADRHAEVTQQSKARNKDEFLHAFSPIIADATATAYRGASNEIQGKLRRVVEVWRDRMIFEPPIQEAIEARIGGKLTYSATFVRSKLTVLPSPPSIELDRARGGKSSFGSSIFGHASSSAVPPELVKLAGLLSKSDKASAATTTPLATADAEYARITDPAAPVPAAPVHAARLNGLLKTLVAAEAPLAESGRAAADLVAELTRLLKMATTRKAKADEALQRVRKRREEIDKKKDEVEQAIMQGLHSSGNAAGGHPAKDGNGGAGLAVEEQEPPVASPLTPPHRRAGGGAFLDEPEPPEMESFTPPSRNEWDDGVGDGHDAAKGGGHQNNSSNKPSPLGSVGGLPSYQSVPLQFPGRNGAGGADAPPSNKRRRLDSAGNDDFPDLGGDDGIDADVAEMLKRG